MICMQRETPSAVATHCRGCKTARGGEGGGEGKGGEGKGGDGEGEGAGGEGGGGEGSGSSNGIMGGGLSHGVRGDVAPAKRKLRPSPRQHCTEYVTSIVGVLRNSKRTAVSRTSSLPVPRLNDITPLASTDSTSPTSPGSAGLSHLFP